VAKVKKLNARSVMTLPVGKHNDGGSLWLIVRPNGSRAWVFRYAWQGRRREMGLGPLDTVSLAEARDKARDARQTVRDGKDPITVREERDATAPTFAEAAAAYVEAHRAGWRNVKHAAQWESTLRTYAEPFIGSRSVDSIATEDVLEILMPLWTTKPETAARLRGRIERVLDWCRVRGYRHGDNPARWRGHLAALLPPRSRVRTVRHHRALPWSGAPAFMRDLKQRDGMAARALEFLILTAARSGEVRGARWSEVDVGTATWTVPAERMKAGREHRVPLSPRAMELLQALPTFEGTDLIFPGVRGGPLSDMSLSAVTRRMKVDAVPHGFRSSFRDWAAESTAYPREVAEAALAHTIPDEVEAAYRRSDLFGKRRKLMAEWAAFLDRAPAEIAAVVPLEPARKARSRA